MKKFKMLNVITENSELTMKEKMVAHYFIYKSNQEGICYPSIFTIAKACGSSERTIQRAARKLEEMGFLHILNRYINGKQTSNEYKLNFEMMEEVYNRRKPQCNEQEVKSQYIQADIIDFEVLIQGLAEQRQQGNDDCKEKKAMGIQPEEKDSMYGDSDLKMERKEFKKIIQAYYKTKNNISINEKGIIKSSFREDLLDKKKEFIKNSKEEDSQKMVLGVRVSKTKMSLKKFIKWKFLHSHNQDRTKLIVASKEAKIFWNFFLAGDLYDRAVEYRDYLKKI